MKRFVAALWLIGGCAALAIAWGDAPEPLFPDRLRWESPPNLPGLQAVWVVGAERRPRPYLLRVKLAGGGRIPPHTHPDARNTTVLAGTLHVGFGATFDEARLVAIPGGAVYVAPAGVPHYVWAKDGDSCTRKPGWGRPARRSSSDERLRRADPIPPARYASSQRGSPQCGQVLTRLADLMVFLMLLISFSICLSRFLLRLFLGTASSLTTLSRSFLIFDSKTGTKFSTGAP